MLEPSALAVVAQGGEPEKAPNVAPRVDLREDHATLTASDVEKGTCDDLLPLVTLVGNLYHKAPDSPIINKSVIVYVYITVYFAFSKMWLLPQYFIADGMKNLKRCLSLPAKNCL